MVCIYRFDDTLIVVNSNDNFIENIFSASSSLILTQAYIAILREGFGITKRFPFQYNKNKKHADDIKLGLYRVVGSMLDDSPFEIVEDILVMIIKQHKKLIEKNDGSSVSVFSDKDLFDTYFEMLNAPEIKFQKIFFLDSEEEEY